MTPLASEAEVFLALAMVHIWGPRCEIIHTSHLGNLDVNLVKETFERPLFARQSISYSN